MRTPAQSKVLAIKTILVFHQFSDCPDQFIQKQPQGRNKHDHKMNCQSATNNTKGMENSLESRANKSLHQEIRLNPLENFNLAAVIGLNVTGRCWGWGIWSEEDKPSDLQIRFVRFLCTTSEQSGKDANCRFPS